MQVVPVRTSKPVALQLVQLVADTEQVKHSGAQLGHMGAPVSKNPGRQGQFRVVVLVLLFATQVVHEVPVVQFTHP
jgi:hypothetical protein